MAEAKVEEPPKRESYTRKRVRVAYRKWLEKRLTGTKSRRPVAIAPSNFELWFKQGRDYDLDNRTHVRLHHAPKA